ncbi:MAG: PaaI family thioesterase [Tannerellaceae bacterium]|jgi:acyl-CoA thioesterase|nr:PaaI family thioesterase [Tannerellaceae bacterium]
MDTKELLAADSFAQNAGIRLTHLSPGYAKAQMEITPAHLNGGGVCQGGAIFTLADFAAAAAANSHGILTFSVSSTVNFFQAQRQGTLFAEAHEVFDHKRLSHCEVRITNQQGDLIASFCGMSYRKS